MFVFYHFQCREQVSYQVCPDYTSDDDILHAVSSIHKPICGFWLATTKFPSASPASSGQDLGVCLVVQLSALYHGSTVPQEKPDVLYAAVPHWWISVCLSTYSVCH